MMAKCARCGQSGLTLKVDFDNLCINCHQTAKSEASQQFIEMEMELMRLRDFHQKYESLPERTSVMEHELSQLRAFHDEYKVIPDANVHAQQLIDAAKLEAETIIQNANALKVAAEATATRVIADINEKISALLRESASDFHFRSRVKVAETHSKARKTTPKPCATAFFTPLTISAFKKRVAKNGYIAFDLETTGLSPTQDKIIEIAAVRCDQYGKEVDRFSTLVNPQCPIPSTASAINHITDDLVASAPVIKIAMADFIRFIGDSPLPLVAHNAEFDISFLSAALSELSISLTADFCDTLQMARKEFQLSSYRLDSVCTHIGYTITYQHRALGDARAVAAIVNECCGL